MTPTTKPNVEEMERTAICTTSTNQRNQKQEKSYLWALESWNPTNPLSGVEISFFLIRLSFQSDAVTSDEVDGLPLFKDWILE